MDDKIADLERKRDGAGKYGRIFEAQIQGFRQCTVQWEAPAVADDFDLRSTNSSGEGNYGETSAA